MFLTRSDLIDSKFVLKKAKKLQVEITVAAEDELIVATCENKNEYCEYNQQNFEIEMSEINHIEYNHQNLSEIKLMVSQALQAEKKTIRIKSLKKLQKSMKDIESIIDNLNNI